MHSKIVILELLPNRIDIVVFERGRRARGQRIALELSDDPIEWEKLVRRKASTVRGVVQELDCAGAQTLVSYRSPTHAVDRGSFAVRSSAEACEAALLQVTESISYSPLGAVFGAYMAGRNRSGSPSKKHVVVAAERNETAEAIVEFVTDSGLSFVSATPVDAVILAKQVEDAVASKAEQAGELYIGEYTSFFTLMGEGQLHFGRRINLGCETLVLGLTRPIRMHPGAEPVELDADTAREILHTCGIPEREQSVHTPLGLRGRHVIPAMQPALQRFIVELRQSLRFGLPSDLHPDMTVAMTGPGSRLPNLGKLIAEELGIKVEASDEYAAFDYLLPGSPGSELAEAMQRRSVLTSINLQPMELSRQRQTSRLRRWMWTGAAAALAYVGIETVISQKQLSEAREPYEAHVAQARDLEQSRETAQRLYGVINAMTELENRIQAEVGETVDYAAAMKELTHLTPSSVRLTGISFSRSGSDVFGSLSGYAFSQSPESEETSLQRFIAAMRESPLFDDVVLGNVQMGIVAGSRGERFQATFRSITTPSGMFRQVDAQSQDGQP